MKHSIPFLSLLSVLLLPLPSGAASPSPAPVQGLTPSQRALIHRSNGVYSVLEAAAAGDIGVLRSRLQAGANPNERDELGNRPLHLATRNGSMEAVRLLLAAGADCLMRDARGQSPMEICQQEDMAELFRQAADKRLKELAALALISSGQAQSLREALRAGVNPDACSEDGADSLLMVAVEKGQEECLRALLEAHAHPNVLSPASGLAPLHLAAQRGQAGIIRQLLDAGAEPMLPARNGALPLHDALWYRELDAVKALLPAYKGVGFNPDGGFLGFPVNLAIQRGGETFLKAFLDAGLQPDDEHFGDATPLMTAAKSGKESCVRLLLEAGADPHRRDSHGRTAADYAPESLVPLLR